MKDETDLSAWFTALDASGEPVDGRAVDGIMLGNGGMYVVEGMNRAITRKNKSRVADVVVQGRGIFDGVLAYPGNGCDDAPRRAARIPLHYLQWVDGPVYSSRNIAHGFYAELSYRSGNRVHRVGANDWDEQRQYRFRRTNIVKTTMRSRHLSVTVIDFVHPAKNIFARRVTVRNRRASPLSGLRLALRFSADDRNWLLSGIGREDYYTRNVRVEPDRRRVRMASRTGLYPDRTKRLDIHAPGAETFTADKIGYPSVDLAPGAETTAELYLATAYAPAAPEAGERFAARRGFDGMLEDTRRHWFRRMGRARLPAAADERCRDFLDGAAVFLLGSFSRAGSFTEHPYSYGGTCYLRDNYERNRLAVALGFHREARRQLMFFRNLFRRMGLRQAYKIEDRYFLPPTVERGDEADGFVFSEFMLFYPLMVRDYYEATGDRELLSAAYGVMKEFMDRQPLAGPGLAAYSGDEVYIKMVPPRGAYSPANTALYVAAARFMAAAAGQLGRGKDRAAFLDRAKRSEQALDRCFWRERDGFFLYAVDANGKRGDGRVNLHAQSLPFFYGALDADDPRLGRVVETVLGNNVFSTMRAESLSGGGYCTGNTAGQLLYLLTLAGHPRAEAAFGRLLAEAGSMGTFGEYHQVTARRMTHGERLRTGETSANALAILNHLPPGPRNGVR